MSCNHCLPRVYNLRNAANALNITISPSKRAGEFAGHFFCRQVCRYAAVGGGCRNDTGAYHIILGMKALDLGGLNPSSARSLAASASARVARCSAWVIRQKNPAASAAAPRYTAQTRVGGRAIAFWWYSAARDVLLSLGDWLKQGSAERANNAFPSTADRRSELRKLRRGAWRL